VQRQLLHPVDAGWLGQPGYLQHRGRHIDHVVELGPELPLGLDPGGPVDDGAVAGPAPVGGDLLGPLIRDVHGMGPADRVVVVGLRGPELVDPCGHELGRLDVGGAVEGEQLVEGAVQGAFGRGAVVADDQIDQGVVQDLQLSQGIDEPADMMVGMLKEPGVHLHLPGQHRLQLLRHVIPRRDLRRPRGQLSILGDHPQLLLPGEGLLPQLVPAPVKAAFVPVRPLGPDVVGGVGGPGGEIDEERLVSHQRLLLVDPVDRPVGHILGEVENKEGDN
jgi:hypothetical protein